MISDRPGADTTVGGRLTPETVRRVDFPRTPLGRRGYHETDVERFRNRVVMEIVTANAEKAELRQEIQRLRDYYRRQGIAQQAPATGSGGRRGARASQAATQASQATANANQANQAGQAGDERPKPGPVTGQLSVDAVNVMSRAQQAADQHIAQAEEYARRLIATARAQYEEILVRAHEEAEKASAEATELLEQQRAQTQSQHPGQPELLALPSGLPEQPSGRIDPSQAAHLQQLESRLTYMRTFAQVTQVQLRSILDALGEELDHLQVPVPAPATPPSGGVVVPSGVPG